MVAWSLDLLRNWIGGGEVAVVALVVAIVGVVNIVHLVAIRHRARRR